MITAEQFPEISLKHNISAVPTLVLLIAGKEVDRVDGANPSQLSTKLMKLVSSHLPIRLNFHNIFISLSDFGLRTVFGNANN